MTPPASAGSIFSLVSIRGKKAPEKAATTRLTIIAKAIIHSGSYMLYGRHASSPNDKIFENIKLKSANFSGRMDNLRSAILIPQLSQLDNKILQWNKLYDEISANLKRQNGIFLPKRDKKEY